MYKQLTGEGRRFIVASSLDCTSASPQIGYEYDASRAPDFPE